MYAQRTLRRQPNDGLQPQRHLMQWSQLCLFAKHATSQQYALVRELYTLNKMAQSVTLMSVSGSTLLAVDCPKPIMPPRPPPPPIPPIGDMVMALREIQMRTPTISSVGANFMSSFAGDVSDTYLEGMCACAGW
jgi:hypothetical protein